MGRAVAPDAFVETLFPALRQAAAIARALEGRVANEPKRGESRAAKAALTIADTAAQEAILVPLQERFPEVCIEAEEETATAALFPASGPARVVVDPIDGTLHSFLARRGLYAVMVGLAIAGRYEAALLALPREDFFFAAVRGHGARCARGHETLRPVRARRDGSLVLVSHELPEPIRRRLAERGYPVASASGGAIAVAPLIPGVAGGVRMAAGVSSISVRGRIGALIAREAGARVCGADGLAFPDDLETPARALLVAAEEADCEELLGALAG